MKFEPLDRVDRVLLTEVQNDCRQPVAELAVKASLSASACHRRLKLLEERGVIESYTARLGALPLGFASEFFVEITLSAQTEAAFEKFERAVLLEPEILQCHLMSGQFDYLLRIAATDAADYERIHRSKLSRLPGVQRIQSALALRTVKRWSGYPLQGY